MRPIARAAVLGRPLCKIVPTPLRMVSVPISRTVVQEGLHGNGKAALGSARRDHGYEEMRVPALQAKEDAEAPAREFQMCRCDMRFLRLFGASEDYERGSRGQDPPHLLGGSLAGAARTDEGRNLFSPFSGSGCRPKGEHILSLGRSAAIGAIRETKAAIRECAPRGVAGVHLRFRETATSSFRAHFLARAGWRTSVTAPFYKKYFMENIA